jgi:hypothetical protein
MKATAWKILSFFVLALALCGCSSWGNPFAGWYGGNPITNLFGGEKTVPAPEPNVMPANYRANLLNFLERELFDPNDIRDAYISEPKLMPFGSESRYAICVRYNAKSGYGQYTGVRDYVAIYFHGDLTQFIPASREQCANAAYVRWPELEGIRKRQS